jgi:hypothetical protein
VSAILVATRTEKNVNLGTRVEATHINHRFQGKECVSDGREDLELCEEALFADQSIGDALTGRDKLRMASRFEEGKELAQCD